MANRRRTVLYVGVTNDIHRRVREHRIGFHPKSFTWRYNLDRLVWFDVFPTAYEAITAEKIVKGWRRSKKVALIERTNPGWEDVLSEQRDSSLRSE